MKTRRTPYALGLIAPAVISLLTFLVMGKERGYLVSGLTSAALFSAAALLWLRQIRRYPNDPWKFRL